MLGHGKKCGSDEKCLLGLLDDGWSILDALEQFGERGQFLSPEVLLLTNELGREGRYSFGQLRLTG